MKEVTFTDVKSYIEINMKLAKNIWMGYHKGIVLPLMILFFMFTFCVQSKAQTYSIPDSNFQQYLINTFPNIMDGNGDLIISRGEDSVRGTLNCSNLNIKDLSGIQFLKNVRKIYCNDNQITFIPSLAGYNDFLEVFDCSNNLLELLPTFNTIDTSLRVLNFNNNRIKNITSFPYTPNLDSLDCSFNNLGFDDLSNINPPTFYFKYWPQSPVAIPENIELLEGNNYTFTFPQDNYHNDNRYNLLKNNTTFRDLNNIDSTSLSNVTSTDSGNYSWSVTNSQFPNLTLTSTMLKLTIYSNDFYKIPDANFRQFLINNYPSIMNNNGNLIMDLAPSVRGTMDCSNKNIKDLSGIEYFVNISNLLCNQNQLTEMPSLANLDSLQRLNCSNNQLSELPLFKSGAPELRYLNYSNNLIDTLPNFFTFVSLDTIICENNRLTFGDFVNIDSNNIQVFTYAPQSKIEVLPRVELLEKDSLTLTFPVDKNVFTNQYKVFKNNVLYQDLGNINSFTISQVATSDVGLYTWQVTNNKYPDLILKSNEIEVVVVNRDNRIFTPDGDGINDNYYISCEYSIKIYNKLGVVVKELIETEYWDGTDQQGKPVQSGAYILRCGDKIISSVTLIR